MSLFGKLFGNKNKAAQHPITQVAGEKPCSDKQELLERYGCIALEKQSNFDDLVQNFAWEVDMKKGRISFAGKMSFPVQILGTLSYSSTTWLWSWANKRSDIPANMQQQAELMKEYGIEHAIDLLSDSEFNADDRDLGMIGLIASGMFNASGYYLADYKRGMMCVTVKSNDIDCIWKNSHRAVLTTFPQFIALYEHINHKNALSHYLKIKGYQVSEVGNTLTALRKDDSITAQFDHQHRLTKLSG